MSDRGAFLRAIRDRPHDDLPRLVYADWLDEHGDPERAEFIRLQCALAAAPPGGRDADRRRERALLMRHGRAWRRGQPQDGAGPFFRGFVVPQLVMSAAEFVAAGDDLFRDAPLWSVRLHEARPVLAAVLASPHLGRLYGLSMPNTGLDAEDAGRIAACAALAELRELELPGNQIWSEGLEALAASPYLAKLRTLDLSDNAHASYAGTGQPTFTDAAVRALVDSPHLGNLETVRLRLTDISGPAWRSLLGRFGAGLMWDRTLPELEQRPTDGP